MIYKGTQKKMIMLKNTGSEYFDEAYFIIKDGVARSDSECENDMIKEANRIISETFRRTGECESASAKEHTNRTSGRGIWYGAGVLCGMAAAFILSCLLR